MDTVERGEMVEKENDAAIRRRHAKRVKEEGRERPEEVAWAESVRRHNAAARDRHLWEWLRFYEEQERRHTANYEALVARYRAEAERCRRWLGIDDGEEAA